VGSGHSRDAAGYCGRLSVAIALLARMAHFTGYLAGSRTALYYWPVLACRKFEAAAEAILQGSAPSGPFVYASPLYRYLILPAYAAGAGRTVLFVIQSLMGVLTAWLLFRLCLRAGAGPRSSLAASALWSLYPPVVFYELTVLPVAVLTLLLTSFTLMLARSGGGGWRAGAAGLLAGLSAGLRPPFTAVMTVPFFRWARGREWLGMAAAAGSFMLPLLFISYEHSVAGGGFYPFPRSTGINLVLGHSSESTGYGPPIPSMGLVETGRGDIHDVAASVAADSGHGDPASADAFWTRKALSWVLHHPAEELRLLSVKMGGFFGWRGFDSYYDMGRVRRFNPVLSFFPVNRWAPVLLFLVGLLPFCIRGRHRALILAPVAAALASTLLFVHSERYFLPVLPMMMASGVSGLTVLVGNFHGRRVAWAAAGAAGLILAVPALLHPVPGVPEPLFVGSLAVRAYHMEDWDLALELFERSALLSPYGSVPWVQGHREAARIAGALGLADRAEQHLLMLRGAGLPP